MPTGLRCSSAPSARFAGAPRVEALEGRRLLAAGATEVPRVVFNDPIGGSASPTRTLTLKNPGTAALAVTGISLVGDDAEMFRLVTKPEVGSTVSGGGSVQAGVAFAPPSGASLGVKTATLRITTTSTATPRLEMSLRGLATAGETGANEPSLQRVFELFELPIDAGDADPATSAMSLPLATPNDAVRVQTFIKAGDGPVTVEALAVFASAGSPTIRFGHYDPDDGARTQVLSVAESQRTKPAISGNTSFDPGSGAFGLYATAPAFGDRTAYTQDFRNTFEPVESSRRKVLLFPMPGEADAFVVGFEEVTGSFDFQDFVAVVRNVRDASAAPPPPPPPPPLPPPNDPAEPELTVLQNGAPLAIGTAVDFGSAMQGEAGPQRTFTLSNEGDASLALGPVIVPAGFELVAGPSVASLAPGASTEILVRVQASAAGTFQGQVIIASNDADEAAFTLNVSGTVTPPPPPPPAPPADPPVVAPVFVLERVSAAVPPMVLAGKSTRIPITFTLRNVSGAELAGPLAVSARLGDPQSPDGVVVGALARNFKLKPGASRSLKLKAAVPADAPVGDTSLVVSATASGQTHATPAAAFRVEPAFVRLVVPHAVSETPMAFTFGRRARLAVPVQNVGTVAATRSSVTYDLVVSATGDGISPVYQTAITSRVNLKPGAMKRQPLRIRFDPAFAPGTYFLLIRLDGALAPVLSFSIAW